MAGKFSGFRGPRDYTAISQDTEASTFYLFSNISHFEEYDFSDLDVKSFKSFLDSCIDRQVKREQELMDSVGCSSVKEFTNFFLENSFQAETLSNALVDEIVDNILQQTNDNPNLSDWNPNERVKESTFNRLVDRIEVEFTKFIDDYNRTLDEIVGDGKGHVGQEMIQSLNKLRRDYAQAAPFEKGKKDPFVKSTLRVKIRQMMKTTGIKLAGEIGEYGVYQALAGLAGELGTAKTEIKWMGHLPKEENKSQTKIKADLKLGDIGFQSKNYYFKGENFEFYIHSTTSPEALGKFLGAYNSSFSVKDFIFNFVNLYSFAYIGDKHKQKYPMEQAGERWLDIVRIMNMSAAVWIGMMTVDGARENIFTGDSHSYNLSNVDFYVVGRDRIMPASTILKIVKERFIEEAGTGPIQLSVRKGKVQSYDPRIMHKEKMHSDDIRPTDTKAVYPASLRKVGARYGRQISKGADIRVMLKMAIKDFDNMNW